jgi:hypothetical protein
VRHITLEEAIAAGQVSHTWADEHKALWGETSPIYRNRVCGEFAEDDTDGVIPLDWVEAAMERWRTWMAGRCDRPWPRVTAIGVDVARSGPDRTVYALLADTRELTVILEIRRRPFAQDTRATLADLRGLVAKTGAPIVMDAIGYGAPLIDELREAQLDVRAFNASARTEVKDRSGELSFANLRAAGWWRLRDRLDPSSKQKPVALPQTTIWWGTSPPRAGISERSVYKLNPRMRFVAALAVRQTSATPSSMPSTTCSTGRRNGGFMTSNWA